MRAPNNANTTRLDFRLRPDQKRLIEQAAEESGRTVTDFAIECLMREAERALESTRMRVLSERDSKLFLAMLREQPKPNAAMRAAARAWEENQTALEAFAAKRKSKARGRSRG
jgi:uncharacterized protein (DUF1778 family)